MIVPDVNVLVHLYRPGSREHELAEAWRRDYWATGEPLTVPDLVWVGFLRIVTNRRVYREPASPADAWGFADALTQQGRYVHYTAHPHLLQFFRNECLDAGAAGNLVTDTYIAATALALGATLVTFDRDFRRFDGLSVRELG